MPFRVGGLLAEGGSHRRWRSRRRWLSHKPKHYGRDYQNQTAKNPQNQCASTKQDSCHRQDSPSQDQRGDWHKADASRSPLRRFSAGVQGVQLAAQVGVVLAFPFVSFQPAAGGSQRILPFRQRGGVQRRFRRQHLPRLLRFRLEVLQRPLFLGQLRPGLLCELMTLSSLLLPEVYLVANDQRRVEGLQFVFAPLVPQVGQVFAEVALHCPQFGLALRQVADGVVEAAAPPPDSFDEFQVIQQGRAGYVGGCGFLSPPQLPGGFVPIFPVLTRPFLDAVQPGYGILREVNILGNIPQLRLAVRQRQPVLPAIEQVLDFGSLSAETLKLGVGVPQLPVNLGLAGGERPVTACVALDDPQLRVNIPQRVQEPGHFLIVAPAQVDLPLVVA